MARVTQVQLMMIDAREQQFLEVLKHFPNDGTTLFGLASYYRDTGRTAESIQRFRECVEHNPGYGAAYLNLGQLLEESGDSAGARRVYETARDKAEATGDTEIVGLASGRLKELAED